MGLAFDEWDLDYYTNMFREELKRDPTNVELFDIAQSNSEHSRHVVHCAPHGMQSMRGEHGGRAPGMQRRQLSHQRSVPAVGAACCERTDVEPVKIWHHCPNLLCMLCLLMLCLPSLPPSCLPRRHWFFGADLFVDGEKMPENLMDIVKSTLKANKGNSVIGFKDNSSAIRGGPVTPMLPTAPGGPSSLEPQPRDWDVLLTAETHNFPCAVAPYPGAETGAGGRIRDTHATGIGSMMGAATAGYCVGNLHMDG
jgi:phosphoribosylformylglycinamidine (FGAM) synthase-like enzyme